MAFTWGDGGGLHYGTATAFHKWDGVGSTTWSLVNAGTDGRWGGKCLEATLAGGVHGGWSKDVPAQASRWTQFWFRWVSGSGTTPCPIMGFFEGATRHVGLYLVPSTGKLQIRRGTVGAGTQVGSDSVITLTAGGAGIAVKFKTTIHDSAGTVDVIFDDGTGPVTVFAITGADTKEGGTGVIDRMWVGANAAFGSGTIAVVRWNDIAFGDMTGSAPMNDFHDFGRIHGKLPTGDGDVNEWTQSTGATHFGVVDEDPPNTTDYESTTTSGHRALYTHDALPVTPTTIYAVQVNNSVQKDDAGTDSIAAMIKTGGTEFVGTNFSVSGATYRNVWHAWEENPDTTAPWTVSEINALQRGVKRI